jgi:hypothetical protein
MQKQVCLKVRIASVMPMNAHSDFRFRARRKFVASGVSLTGEANDRERVDARRQQHEIVVVFNCAIPVVGGFECIVVHFFFSCYLGFPVHPKVGSLAEVMGWGVNSDVLNDCSIEITAGVGECF